MAEESQSEKRVWRRKPCEKVKVHLVKVHKGPSDTYKCEVCLRADWAAAELTAPLTRPHLREGGGGQREREKEEEKERKRSILQDIPQNKNDKHTGTADLHLLFQHFWLDRYNCRMRNWRTDRQVDEACWYLDGAVHSSGEEAPPGDG